MGTPSSDGRLRFETLTLEPSDDLVHRLADAARNSRPGAPGATVPRRLLLAVAAFLGFGAVSVGGAWASGAIDVPGMPASPWRPASEAPRNPGPPAGAGVTDAGADVQDPERPLATASQAQPRGTASVAPATPAADQLRPAPEQPATGRPSDPGQQGRDSGGERGRGHDKPKGKPADKPKGKPTDKPKDAGAAESGRDKERGGRAERDTPARGGGDAVAGDDG